MLTLRYVWFFVSLFYLIKICFTWFSSSHLSLVRLIPHRTFEELAILPNGTVNEAYRPLAISMYHQNVHRWLEVFSRDQLLVVNGDQLIEDPLSQVKRIESFLGKFLFCWMFALYCISNEVIKLHTVCRACTGFWFFFSSLATTLLVPCAFLHSALVVGENNRKLEYLQYSIAIRVQKSTCFLTYLMFSKK